MIRAVIDTNVLVSALRTRNPDSPTIRIYYAILSGEILVLHSPEIIAEYEDVLHRDKFAFDSDCVDEIIDFIKTRGQSISLLEIDSASFPDPDDRVFYCTALAAQDEDAMLVTGNARHFPDADFVLTPSEFVEILDSQM